MKIPGIMLSIPENGFLFSFLSFLKGNSIRFVFVDLFERNPCCDSDKNGETRGYNLLKINFSSSFERVFKKSF